MNENPSPETLADATRTSAADGGGTVESPSIKLEDLNKVFGTDFKDAASALRSVKETKDFVGRRKDDIAAELKASMAPAQSPDVELKSQVQNLQEQLFYTQNPQYKGYENVIKAMGSNPADVVGTEVFKGIFEKAKVADEVAQTKSIVASNARLSQSKTVIDEAVNIANARGTTLDQVAVTFAREINAQGRGEK